ncbi:unnamed protein product [Musa hybrid cultivar]
MKLESSGLQYFPSVTGGGVDGLGEDLFAAPSFQLPDSFDMVKPAKWTTTLAFILKNGVIVAADSRAGMGGYILFHVGPDGRKKLSGDDVSELHCKYYPVVPTSVEQEMAEAPAA